ncbi:MAG: bifunctional demethylmenaquinone methyltransferase/2-methoxy-6-polyprenyl-1,4-benzoquinol methylase UbiE [Lentimicrobiaceae bacterium]|jgi:demethylmenaquinone methyltransferase / 2-methoxy-6-polyprenyl-1,4-benzoquinol methylase|nr:bifunctional demethylmenaquinone methyltransferase/2-methoxy-6-polyprenyl-1,4-benzoquinol methylase UbiE [Lentimicrobiaceae bacterium]MBT3454369.1 bifunctional demethylmenaquinone methyltransferase/2-methoxy-6-polyprenyl-1,4-benzoquinol methylase UbiE [Lentimicrobiaceae bacterium]MBT3817704.1 bifunctional demethylmenaquinone methyltransferase/2-methoxy-6-polyprenyl-1,4-benzoquinol methylase UbiE [Lentimicrobiaceae bacterium]MBT4060630.1 bifunctional demethylmenaquinone methyltransferase/2-met
MSNNSFTHKPKKEQVRTMFNDIAHRYDFLNHFLSAGIDIQWRKKVKRLLVDKKHDNILDVATGTADLAIELSKLNPKHIHGVDIAVDMLDIGKLKIRKKGLGNLITLQEGDAENLNFDDGSFDAATVAFGVRNFETLQKGLMEMHRVINTGGIIIVLEFSKPKAFPFKQLYNFYFRFILPLFGQFVSKSNSAYTYLPNSVKGFAEDEVFMNELKKAGFKRPKQQRLTMGIATIYYAHK